MKKCPICGSLVSDSDLTCGVCGRGLSEVNQVIEDGEATAAQKAKPRWHVNVPGLSGLSMGLAFVGIGVYLFTMAATYAGALLSLLAIGFGILVIAITRDLVENRRYTDSRYRRDTPYGFRGYTTSRYVRNEKSVEDEEDRKRASGEAD